MQNSQSKKNNSKGKNTCSSPVFYEIRVKGQLNQVWASWFEGMTLADIEDEESGLVCTLIAGPVIDQPALYGLLTKIQDLNLTLISVRRFGQRDSTDEEVSHE